MPYKTLISCSDAATQLNRKDWRFIDCRFDLMQPEWGQEQYHNGHIFGAVYAHLDHDLSSAVTQSSGRHPLPDIDTLVKRLRLWGVGDGTQVVVYDQGNGMYAARLWWLLRWLGHDAVAVLDGGYAAWVSQGYPINTETKMLVPGQFTVREPKAWVVEADDIPAWQQAGELLLDARAAERYRGEVEPIDPIAGHIPGALNYPLTNNIGDDGLFKDSGELRTQISDVIGTISPDQVIHYCGSGVSACHNILAMEQAGLAGSKLYAGSWSEWIRDTTREVAKDT